MGTRHTQFFMDKEYPNIPMGGGGGGISTYTGTTSPSGSLGNNGDLYFQTKSFQKVDYIQTNGGDKTQCIKTDVKMTTDTEIILKTKVFSTVYSNWQGILGFRNSTPFYGLYTRCNDANVFGDEYNSTSAQIASDAGIYDVDIEITANAHGWTWTDGTNTGTQSFEFQGVGAEGLNLGSANFSGAYSNEQGKYNFYEAIFSESGVEMLHLVPIINNNHGAMVDILTGQIYESINTNNHFSYGQTLQEYVNLVFRKYVKIDGTWMSF